MSAKNPELQYAKTAEYLVRNSLIREIRSLGMDHSNSTPNRKNKKMQKLTPLLQSSAHHRMVKGDRTKLSAIAIHMGKHGFVHHFGANGYRESHEVMNRKGTRFTRKGHQLKIKSQDFVGRAVERSGAVPFLVEKIGAVRAEIVVAEISKAFI